MNITIVGAGALGSLFGGLLARSGEAVWLYDPFAHEHIAELRSRELVIEEDGHEERVAVRATTDIAEVEATDLLALFVKAPHTRDAIAQALAAVQPATQVLSLQNGLGIEEVLLQYVQRERLLRGVTSQGSTLIAPGRVRHAGRGPTYIGQVGGRGCGETVRSVVEVFNRAGLETHYAEDVEHLVWRKLFANVGINALTAIFDVQNGTLVADGELAEIMRGAVREAVEVARRKGLDFVPEHVTREVEHVCQITSQNVSSMLQDVRRGAATEVGFINGAVVRESERLGLEAPVNRLLLKLVEALPNMKRRPS